MATAGAGESWCEHELLNTVTTAWVEDHLGDPELSFLLLISRRHGTVRFAEFPDAIHLLSLHQARLYCCSKASCEKGSGDRGSPPPHYALIFLPRLVGQKKAYRKVLY